MNETVVGQPASSAALSCECALRGYQGPERQNHSEDISSYCTRTARRISIENQLIHFVNICVCMHRDTERSVINRSCC
jgi:hypothetical protein